MSFARKLRLSVGKDLKMQKKKQNHRVSFLPSLTGREGEGLLVFVYITAKNKSEAKKIGMVLLQERLAACVNIFDKMSSMYWWKGKIEEANETVLIAKTTKKLFPKLSTKVKAIHSYSVPCILQLEVKDGNKEYVEWLLA